MDISYACFLTFHVIELNEQGNVCLTEFNVSDSEKPLTREDKMDS